LQTRREAPERSPLNGFQVVCTRRDYTSCLSFAEVTTYYGIQSTNLSLGRLGKICHFLRTENEI
jgi:hypothetical protein